MVLSYFKIGKKIQLAHRASVFWWAQEAERWGPVILSGTHKNVLNSFKSRNNVFICNC